jgi:hypothetical protein
MIDNECNTLLFIVPTALSGKILTHFSGAGQQDLFAGYLYPGTS